MTTNTEKTDDISDKKIVLSVKDFIAVCLFVLSIGTSIGGFIKVLNDFDRMDKKVDNINSILLQLKGDTENLKGQLQQLTKNNTSIEKNPEKNR